MALRLHNTLTKRVEEFRPLRAGRVTFYTCGPTVYDYAHIGNFRSFLAADVLRRWLESPLCVRVTPEGEVESGPGGYAVTHVMNITDVGHMVDDEALDGGGEDKMEAARRRLLADKKSGRLPAGADIDPNDPYAIAGFYADAFIEDAKTLGMRVVEEAEGRPELMPRPTRMIRPMLEMVVRLIEGGHAYIARDGVAYFDTQTFPEYGRLSGNTLEKIKSGAGGRVSEAAQAVKRHPADFMLWKPDPSHLMRWDPREVLGRDVGLGEGYPGWHLECSVMASVVLGEEIDLHSGGEDNIFPHHECEIAQSRCAFGRPALARYWFHPRFLMVEGGKMSKSKGTFYTVRDLLGRGFSPAAIRLELIKTHYRSNANFTEQGLVDSQRRVDRWRSLAKKLHVLAGNYKNVGVGPALEKMLRDFADAMNEDVNTSRAIAAVDTACGEVDNAIQAHFQDSGKEAEQFRQRVDAYSLAECRIENRQVSFVETMNRAFGGELLSAAMDYVDNVLGVVFLNDAPGVQGEADRDAARIDALIAARAAARKERDFKEADRIRDELAGMGVEITDGPEGTAWSRRARL